MEKREKDLSESACFTYKKYMDQNLNGASPVDKDELKEIHTAAMKVAVDELQEKHKTESSSRTRVEQAERQLKVTAPN